MKNEIYKLILFIAVFLFSCQNTAPGSGDNYKRMNYPEQCYLAVFQKDSAFLKFKTMPKGKIYGRLVLKYSEPKPNEVEKEFDHCEIVGRFSKDTLFADYVFADGTKRTLYKNPIALLKKGSQLIFGFGAIENYVGKTWFINHKAINFTRSRFQFSPVECTN
jgi:hypothetical protein